MSNSLTLKITDGIPDVLLSIEDNGVVRKKVVSIDDITSSLASSYQFSTGILPRGTKFFSGTHTDYSIGIETSAMSKVCDIHNNNAREEDADRKVQLPFPPCLFTFFIKGGKLGRTYVHALRKPIYNESDELYNFPYGNTSYDGGVCWGSVKIPTIKNPMALTVLVNMFLDSKYNGDLFERDTVNFKQLGIKGDSFRALVEAIEDKDKFPPEALNLCSDLNRISNLINKRV